MATVPRFEVQLVKTQSIRYRSMSSSADAINVIEQIMRPILDSSPCERLYVVTVDTKLHPIGVTEITRGTLDASLVHPREVLRPAILQNSSGFFLVHNHPSGDTTPSKQDWEVMRRLQQAGEIMGIDLIDSIIIGDDALSMRERNDW